MNQELPRHCWQCGEKVSFRDKRRVYYREASGESYLSGDIEAICVKGHKGESYRITSKDVIPEGLEWYVPPEHTYYKSKLLAFAILVLAGFLVQTYIIWRSVT